MTDRQDYLNKKITYKDYYALIAKYYGFDELETLVGEWLSTKIPHARSELKRSSKDDLLLNNIDGWINLVGLVDSQRMEKAFSKAGGIMARGEVVCVLKQVARSIAK